MQTRFGSTRYNWGFTLIVTNLAVLLVLFVLVTAGQIRTEHDFLHGLAYALVFSNVTSVLAMLVLGTVLEKLAGRRLPFVPLSLIGMAIVIPVGCLAAQAVLVAIHFIPAGRFWSQYLHVLKVATPLALVFGLGALAYATLRARLEVAELRLREKEVAEERSRKLAAEARLRSLESWIHPHFLFNTLNSISALIAFDPARADQIVGRLATLLRASLDNNSHTLIPLRQELALVESYLDIERVRLGSKLRASIDVPADLAATPVPPMSVQSLVENAVKYGIVPLPTGGDVRVTAVNGGGTIRIAICDSGPGFDLASIPADHGLDKLVQRLDAIFGDGAALHVFRDDGSSVVEMVVPRT
ncbi:MAG TPA: histidine kinase [Acidobacteriaceae bacterium]|jgi:sensor histidine kinase YesM|nr:histidine kinase [Acidobacteriaceae bacterium]